MTHKNNRETETKYRDIFENAPIGLFQITPDGDILTANSVTATILGYASTSELTESPLNFRETILTDSPSRQQFDTLKESPGHTAIEVSAMTPNGHALTLSLIARPIWNAAGECLYYEGTLTDITHQKEEQRIAVEQKAAEAAARAKTQFLENISHEVRTPMNAIMGYTELLEDHIADDRLKQYIAAIRTGNKTLLNLINDILDLSKIEEGKLKLKNAPLYIKTLCREIQKLFKDRIEKKGLYFDLKMGSQLPTVLIYDEVRLRQVLFNLTANAVKFTQQGHIGLQVISRPARRQGSGDAAEPTPAAVDLSIIVEDGGCSSGSSEHQHKRSKFRQVSVLESKKYGGTDLSLTLTLRLVQMMGGAISVADNHRGGTTFKVVFPNVPVGNECDAFVNRHAVSPDTVRFENARLLIVDDNEDNRNMLMDVLKPYGFQLLEAENGREAVDMTARHTPHLILMDLRMPEMDGHQAAELIKSNTDTQHIPIIVLTASTWKITDKKINDSIHYAGYLKKPASREEIIWELKRFLPHTVSPPPPPPQSEEADAAKLKHGTTLMPTELRQHLAREFVTRLDKIEKTLILREIEEFGKDIEDLGGRYEVSELSDWGKQLQELTGRFDMARLPKVLADFKALIDGRDDSTDTRPPNKGTMSPRETL